MGNSLELGNHSANPEQTQALKVTMETGAHRGFQGVGWVGGRMDRWARDGEKGGWKLLSEQKGKGLGQQP